MLYPKAAANPLVKRDDVQQLLRDLVAPLLPHVTAGGAGIDLGTPLTWYGEPCASMEGLLRPLWGLAPLAAGGGTFADWSVWRAGISAGTDPGHPEFWGWPRDADQRIVESAALGAALLLARAQLWDPLPEAAKAHVGAWLARSNDVRAMDNNWLLFPVLANLGLRACGLPWAPDRVATNLDRLEAFHLGNGWYADGLPDAEVRVGDYYGPMAFHFNALLYAASAGDPPRAKRYRERATQFAHDFMHWFTADGAALPFGRSLTYRCAQGAFWGALAFAGVEALPWGVQKGLYLRHLRWWMRQPAFSDTGVLSVGYRFPNLTVAERYNGPASPYWAFKMFLPLALPADHPFWSAAEAPLPARARVHTVPGARMVLADSDATDEVVGLNAGQPIGDWPRHVAHKYCKFAYSTRFGFCVPVGIASLEEGGFDSVLALSDDEGRRYRARERCTDARVEHGVAYSQWQPWPDVVVQTWVVAAGSAHVRVQHLRTARKLVSVEAGFATGFTRRDTLFMGSTAPGSHHASSPEGYSALRDLTGARRGGVVELAPGSHLLHPLAAMPVLYQSHRPGESWFACLVWGAAQATAQPRWAVGAVPGGGFELQREGLAWCTCVDGRVLPSAAALAAARLPPVS